MREHHEDLVVRLEPPQGRLPSDATLRRAVRAVDVAALEERVAQFVASLTPPPRPPRRARRAPRQAGWTGLAVDDKAVRGANRRGARVQLVSLVRHADGLVLAQRAVAAKSNAITAAPRLLAGRSLSGCVVTMDAQLTQRPLVEQVRQQGGHYLVVVKENQPTLAAAIADVFASPPPGLPSDYRAQVTTVSKGHGRLETRALARTAALNDWLAWPDVGQVLRRACQRVILTTGEIQEEVSYGVTSLPAHQTTPATLEALWRGHWTIENQVHHVRDVSFGEDAGRVWQGSAPQALAALRNALLSLLRVLGWTHIADALRHYGAYAPRALHLLSTSPARL